MASQTEPTFASPLARRRRPPNRQRGTPFRLRPTAPLHQTRRERTAAAAQPHRLDPALSPHHYHESHPHAKMATSSFHPPDIDALLLLESPLARAPYEDLRRRMRVHQRITETTFGGLAGVTKDLEGCASKEEMLAKLDGVIERVKAMRERVSDAHTELCPFLNGRCMLTTLAPPCSAQPPHRPPRVLPFHAPRSYEAPRRDSRCGGNSHSRIYQHGHYSRSRIGACLRVRPASPLPNLDGYPSPSHDNRLAPPQRLRLLRSKLCTVALPVLPRRHPTLPRAGRDSLFPHPGA